MIKKAENHPDIHRAVNLLRTGKLVAFPTETVYGLGADASNEIAVRQIFQVKQRPYQHPLIVHLAKVEQLSDWARDITPAVLTLANAFWPGPLTMILKKQPHVLDVLTGGQDTIGIRIPKQALAQALLQSFGKGIAAPSANIFTRISPTSADAVIESLGDKVDLILDGGLCEIGLESTIIDMTQAVPTILRQGMLTQHAISEVLNVPVALGHKTTLTRVPGLHPVHYAPLTHTLLMTPDEIDYFIKMQAPEEFPIMVLKHTQFNLPTLQQVFYVNMSHEAKAYAHELYRVLRSIDHEHMKHLLIEDVPDTIEWQAIRDRLQKASGSREVRS